jgi:hypothetical protein
VVPRVPKNLEEAIDYFLEHPENRLVYISYSCLETEPCYHWAILNIDGFYVLKELEADECLLLLKTHRSPGSVYGDDISHFYYPDDEDGEEHGFCMCNGDSDSD